MSTDSSSVIPDRYALRSQRSWNRAATLWFSLKE